MEKRPEIIVLSDPIEMRVSKEKSTVIYRSDVKNAESVNHLKKIFISEFGATNVKTLVILSDAEEEDKEIMVWTAEWYHSKANKPPSYPPQQWPKRRESD